MKNCIEKLEEWLRKADASLAVEGSDKMAAIMASLRTQAPAEIAGLAVTGVVDYKPGVEMPVVGPQMSSDAPQMLPSADF